MYALKKLKLTAITAICIRLIFCTKCVIVAEIKIYWVQPLIKRQRMWMDHKTLFPLLEIGFLIGIIALI